MRFFSNKKEVILSQLGFMRYYINIMLQEYRLHVHASLYMLSQMEMQRTCSALAVPCSAILQCSPRPLKCICCKHTAASHCRCSVHVQCTLHCSEKCLRGVNTAWGIMYFKGECNALESEVQCTLREAYYWSVWKCALRCTGNALHFDLGYVMSCLKCGGTSNCIYLLTDGWTDATRSFISVLRGWSSCTSCSQSSAAWRKKWGRFKYKQPILMK